MQKEQTFVFPLNRRYPLAVNYSPHLLDFSQDIMNPFLGYPNAPLIGRYNKGQYRIAETQSILEFQCKFNKVEQKYLCGQHPINLPARMVDNLRNIPEKIKQNKPPNSKNAKIEEFHPLRFPVRDHLKFCFVITFGEIGKDFLNYLNHMYTLGNELFVEEKLRRTVHLLPIYAYLPPKSGLMEEQVDKGLNLQNYRSEYMSLHLKYGAPAFSPNNMRLGVEGMKKVQSNPKPKKEKKKKKKYKEKQHPNDLVKTQINQIQNLSLKEEPKQSDKIEQCPKQQEKEAFIEATKQNNDESQLDWDQLEKQIHLQKEGKQLPIEQTKFANEHKAPSQHKGYVHFYTSMLLEEDYRVYYHWHFENPFKRDLIAEALNSSKSLKNLIENCKIFLGEENELVQQLSQIFNSVTE